MKHQNRAPVHQLGLDLWRDLVLRLPRIRRRLLDTLLAHITRERRGEAIDRSLMRSTTQARAENVTGRYCDLIIFPVVFVMLSW